MNGKCQTSERGKNAITVGPTHSGNGGRVLLCVLAAALLLLTGVFPVAAEEYSLWVGGTRVNDENKADILGNGTAVYDPENRTLILKSKGSEISDVYGGSLIYADGIDLTIKTFNGLSLNNVDADSGICVTGDLTIDACGKDVDIRAKTSGVNTSGTFAVTNASAFSVEARREGIRSRNDVLIADCKSVTVKSGIGAERNIMICDVDDVFIDNKNNPGLWSRNGSVSITDGRTLTVNGTYVVYASNGSVTVTGIPYVRATGHLGLYARDDITLGGNVTVITDRFAVRTKAGRIVLEPGYGTLAACGRDHALYAKCGILIPATHGIFIPEKGSIREAAIGDDTVFTVADSDGVATVALIRRMHRVSPDPQNVPILIDHLLNGTPLDGDHDYDGNDVIDGRDLILLQQSIAA